MMVAVGLCMNVPKSKYSVSFLHMARIIRRKSLNETAGTEGRQASKRIASFIYLANRPATGGHSDDDGPVGHGAI